MIFEVSLLQKILKKTSLTACLFIFSNILLAQEESAFILDNSLISAYKHSLNFELRQSRIMLRSYSGPSHYGKIYLEHLNDVIELAKSEDDQLKQSFDEKTEVRISQLKDAPESPYINYYLTEIKLHSTFVHLIFGEEFSAAWNFRQAFILAEKNKEKYPRFELTLKNLGLIHIIIGSTPEKYQWLLNLFGFHGSLQQGIAELKQFSDYSLPFSLESDIMLSFVYSYLLQESEKAISVLSKYNDELNEELLLSYAMASILMKSSRSEEALNVLESYNGDSNSLLIFHYMKGTILQQKGIFNGSTESFKIFLDGFKGHNYIKDVNFKIGLNYWLDENDSLSAIYFDRSRVNGQSITEADKNAEFLLEETMPDRNIMKLRLLTDGGYFEEAFTLVRKVEDSKLENHKDSVEFVYRKARLFHKSGNEDDAVIFYRETINNAGKERWYFAPNSALQLGYILKEKGMKTESRDYFEKALSYKNHPYKTSIDNEAKAALASLEAEQ